MQVFGCYSTTIKFENNQHSIILDLSFKNRSIKWVLIDLFGPNKSCKICWLINIFMHTQCFQHTHTHIHFWDALSLPFLSHDLQSWIIDISCPLIYCYQKEAVDLLNAFKSILFSSIGKEGRCRSVWWLKVLYVCLLFMYCALRVSYAMAG